MSTSATKKRLFFALWPPEDVRERLFAQGGRVLPFTKGRQVIAANLHLTLAFLGAVDMVLMSQVETMASAIKAAPFVLVLDRIGYWPRPHIMWVGSQEMPAPLGELVASLRQGVAACGLEVDARPYRPHVTVLRDARKKPPETELRDPIRWSASAFCLVESQTRSAGASYGVLRSWDLH